MANDYFNPPNSVWPNGLKRDEESYVTFYPLGTNKIKVPTSSSEWPRGNKLVSPFVYQDDKLVGFVDTKAFIMDSPTSIFLPYEHIEAEFSAIDKGQLQIHAPNATTKKASWKDSGVEDIPEVQYKYKGCKTVDNVKTVNANYQTTDIVNGTWSEPLWDLEQGGNRTWDGGMFGYCDKIISFSSDLPKLTDGYCMFYQSTLSEFSSDLSSLTDSSWMFASCGNLTLFNSDLSSLTNGTLMFEYCNNLSTFDCGDLSNLTDGYSMFDGCSKLTTFISDLSSLTDGYSMFESCSKLTIFISDLSSLTDGGYMFSGCKLDASSIKNIIDTINTYSGKLYLGMGCNNTTADKDLFAQEVGYADMTSLLAALKAKGWTVTAQYTGRPTTTYGLRRPSKDTLPVFVQLEETEEHTDYTSEDGSKKFRLDWFHETTGSTEGYTQFNSIEEAVAHYNIKPIERN